MMMWYQAIARILELRLEHEAILALYFSVDSGELDDVRYLEQQNWVIQMELAVVAHKFPSIKTCEFYEEFLASVQMIGGLINDMVCIMEEM